MRRCRTFQGQLHPHRRSLHHPKPQRWHPVDNFKAHSSMKCAQFWCLVWSYSLRYYSIWESHCIQKSSKGIYEETMCGGQIKIFGLNQLTHSEWLWDSPGGLRAVQQLCPPFPIMKYLVLKMTQSPLVSQQEGDGYLWETCQQQQKAWMWHYCDLGVTGWQDRVV